MFFVYFRGFRVFRGQIQWYSIVGEATGGVRPDCPDFEAHSGPYATRNRGDWAAVPQGELRGTSESLPRD